jgi:hypothetical protein
MIANIHHEGTKGTKGIFGGENHHEGTKGTKGTLWGENHHEGTKGTKGIFVRVGWQARGFRAEAQRRRDLEGATYEVRMRKAGGRSAASAGGRAGAACRDEC